MPCFVSKYGLFEFDIVDIKYSPDKNYTVIKILSSFENCFVASSYKKAFPLRDDFTI